MLLSLPSLSFIADESCSLERDESDALALSGSNSLHTFRLHIRCDDVKRGAMQVRGLL